MTAARTGQAARVVRQRQSARTGPARRRRRPRRACPGRTRSRTGCPRHATAPNGRRRPRSEAVQAAERAHELTEHAEAVESEEKQRLEDVRRQLADEVDRRVRAAAEGGRGAGRDGHAARPRQEAEHAFEQRAGAVGGARGGSPRRGRARPAGGPRAVRRGHRAAGPRACSCADEAAALAQDAAERARQDAERISAAAQSGRKQADQAVTQARQLRERTAAGGGDRSPAQVNRTRRPGTLHAMSKADLAPPRAGARHRGPVVDVEEAARLGAGEEAVTGVGAGPAGVAAAGPRLGARSASRSAAAARPASRAWCAPGSPPARRSSSSRRRAPSRRAIRRRAEGT